MQKRLLCAALLAAAACANAAETTWSFTYQGFVDGETGTFLPDVKLTGTFTGSDLNHDGIIVREELSHFSTGRYTFLDPFGSGCAQAWNPYSRCKVNSFSYKLTGELAYSTDQWGNDAYYMGWFEYIRSGDYFELGGYANSSSWSQRYNWSDQTSFTISPAPVPEPATVLMLPAGLAIVWAARRRQKFPCNKM